MNNRVLVWDSRQQKGKHDHILKWFEENNYKIVRSKLFTGDVSYLNDMSICIDTKKDIQELCGNVCQQHKRFTDEIKRAMENEIKLVFLIQDENIKTLEDLKEWKNPRRFESRQAIKGDVLYKTLATIEDRYNTKFYFTTNARCGEDIIKILEKEM